MGLEKITIFKIKKTATEFADFVKSEDGRGKKLPAIQLLTLPEDLRFEGLVEIGAVVKSHVAAQKTQNDIPWLVFLNQGLADRDRFSFKSRNRFPCALVAIKFIYRQQIDFYAMTFGLGGEGLLQSDAIVKDFGIRVAMNICNKDRLKRIQTSSHEAISTHSEKQISIGSSFSVFNIDDEKEFLRALSGSARDEYSYITSLTGRDGIQIKVDKDDSINWNNILPRIQELGAAYDRDDYREKFPGYDKFHFETDAQKIAELDKILFEKIRDGDHNNVHLAPPEFVDSESRDFSYRADEDPRFGDLFLGDLLASKRRPFNATSSIQSIRSMRVYMWDVESGAKVKDWPAYKCIVAEVELDGSAFILSAGQWKRVSDGLKAEVDAYVAQIAIADDQYLLSDVNIWNPQARTDQNGNDIGENREATYNDLVTLGTADVFLFDKAKVEIAGDRAYEVCDLLHRDKDFVHVKRWQTGSASITHLFLQGRFYGDAFLSDQKCRESMRQHILDRIGDGDPAPFVGIVPARRDEVIANEYRIIFCILCTDVNVIAESLPFMARYELVHTHRHLHNALGFRCEVAFRTISLGQ